VEYYRASRWKRETAMTKHPPPSLHTNKKQADDFISHQAPGTKITDPHHQKSFDIPEYFFFQPGSSSSYC
jgi:hypothetical protein